MNLKLNSWHFWLYKHSYSGTPQTLCPYFWKLLFAIVLLPITFMGYLIPAVRHDRNLFLHGLVTFLIGFLIFLGFILGEKHYEGNILLATLYGLGTMLLTICIVCVAGALIAGLIFSIREAVIYIQDKREDAYYERLAEGKEPKKYILVEWWKGFKGKYCPRINWE